MRTNEVPGRQYLPYSRNPLPAKQVYGEWAFRNTLSDNAVDLWSLRGSDVNTRIADMAATAPQRLRSFLFPHVADIVPREVCTQTEGAYSQS